jgi:hypothetical protein
MQKAKTRVIFRSPRYGLQKVEPPRNIAVGKIHIRLLCNMGAETQNLVLLNG